jgi:transcriptional regulator with XRE-family HTH domain
MSHPVDIHVGQQLKRMRILRNLTQTDVAQGLKISFQQVQNTNLAAIEFQRAACSNCRTY